jgi:hypothetical protein
MYLKLFPQEYGMGFQQKVAGGKEKKPLKYIRTAAMK